MCDFWIFDLSHCDTIIMNTPYGPLEVGDLYDRADGSTNGRIIVVDVDTYAYCEDAVYRYIGTDTLHRIDWFKLMQVRYCKVDNTAI